MNRISLNINRVFSMVFTVVFSLLLILILAKGYTNEHDNNTYNCTEFEKLRIIIAFIVFVFSAFVIFYVFNRICNRSKLIKKADKSLYSPLIILTTCAFLFVFQLSCGYLLACKPVTDVRILNLFSADFAKNGNFDLVRTDFMDHYMIKYQNNFAALFLLSLIYRLSYLFTGTVSIYLPTFVNAFAINASVVMTVFLTRRIFGERRAYFVLLLCLLFAPFYTYTAFYYTDSLSMPFLTGSVYLFVYAFNSDNIVKKLILFLLCGALVFLSFKLKGSIIIILCAVLIYAFLKLGIKEFSVLALSFIIGVGFAFGIYTAKFQESGILTEDLSNRYEYPYTHWVMLGLKGYGNYNKADSEYTHSFSDKELKISANLKKIGKRINKYKAKGFVKHLIKKSVWTWEDGTYYISHHIENPVHKNKLHSYVLRDGEMHFVFYEYSCAFQLFLILMMIISAVKSFNRPKLDFSAFLRLVVFGAFLFFLIWETRSRYLYNFTPLFLILAVDGLFAKKTERQLPFRQFNVFSLKRQ